MMDRNCFSWPNKVYCAKHLASFHLVLILLVAASIFKLEQNPHMEAYIFKMSRPPCRDFAQLKNSQLCC